MKIVLPNVPARRNISLATLIGALTIGVMISGCSHQATPAAPPPIVVTARVSDMSTDTQRSYAGEVRARVETSLSFRIGGRLTARLVHLGDAVKKGEVLAEIDPTDANASQRVTEAQLLAAQERLTLAQQTHARNSAEAKEDLVARADLEQSASSLAVAKADVEQLRAQLELAHNQASYTRLIAERDGVITSENAEEGAVLAAGQTVFGFAAAGERDVVIDVAEAQIDGFQVGQTATIALAVKPELAIAAQVRDIAKAADPQSRTFRIKLAAANPDLLRPGQTATVRMQAHADRQTITIPATALFHQGTDTAVWVVDPSAHSLQLRKVDVASYLPDQVVLTRGVVSGEELVIRGVNTVTAGMVVRSAPQTAGSEGV